MHHPFTNHYAESMVALAAETGACCDLFAAGGDCCHSMTEADCYPSDAEMEADGWKRDADSVWVPKDFEGTHAANEARKAEERATRRARLAAENPEDIWF